MTDEQLPPTEIQPPLPAVQQTLLERFGISPILFAAISLVIVFVLYQIVGGVITFLIFGMKPTAENIFGYRLSTGIGQILFLLVPTLILVRFISLKPKEFFRLRAPNMKAFFVPIVGIFSLQVVLQIYLVFQERIPLPPDLEQQLDEFKQLMDEAYKLLVSSNSIPELFWVIFVIALIPAIVEELLFRGLVQRSFEKSMSPMRAAVATGIIFASYHLNPSSFVPLAAIGIYLGFLAMRADSLWVSMATHFYNNALATIIFYFHFDDDYVITGNAEKMSTGMLLFTFWLFGLIFLISTIYFIHITKKPVEHKDAVAYDDHEV